MLGPFQVTIQSIVSLHAMERNLIGGVAGERVSVAQLLNLIVSAQHFEYKIKCDGQIKNMFGFISVCPAFSRIDTKRSRPTST
jgi:hypothetical protein